MAIDFTSSRADVLLNQKLISNAIWSIAQIMENYSSVGEDENVEE